jgi:hypothetical protein
MPSWLIKIRDIIWSSVFAVVLSLAAVLIAIIIPDALSLSISLGLGAVTSALLAQRV